MKNNRVGSSSSDTGGDTAASAGVEAAAKAPRRASSGRDHSPTRETLLRLIEAQDGAISIAQLAAHTGWHDNTVRGHVHALWHDGYLTRVAGRASGQGRPGWRWTAADHAPNEQPAVGLAMALASALERDGADPTGRARQAGREWGRALGAHMPPAETAAEARERVIEVMRAQGFAPRIASSRAARSDSPAHTNSPASTHGARGSRNTGGEPREISLRQCPLMAVASAHSGVVCTVHLGLVEGLLEAVGAQVAAGTTLAWDAVSAASQGSPDQSGTSTNAASAPLGVTLLPFAAPGECALMIGVAA